MKERRRRRWEPPANLSWPEYTKLEAKAEARALRRGVEYAMTLGYGPPPSHRPKHECPTCDRPVQRVWWGSDGTRTYVHGAGEQAIEHRVEVENE